LRELILILSDIQADKGKNGAVFSNIFSITLTGLSNDLIILYSVVLTFLEYIKQIKLIIHNMKTVKPVI